MPINIPDPISGDVDPASLPTTLEGWTQWLQEREMPIFSHTVQRLHDAMEDGRADLLSVARIILEDPAMTAKLLKLGNSAYYNPRRQPISTISRAIVMIGLSVVHDLALACAFIETVISRRNKPKVLQEIGRALHAAVQAKAIAVLKGDPAPEEVFIAALLQNLGQLAFWSCEQHKGAAILTLMSSAKLDEEVAEKQVLGFKLRQLGASLTRSWKLGGLTEESYVKPQAQGPLEAVRLGCELAQLTENGWDSPALVACLDKIAASTGKTAEESLAAARDNTTIAIQLATHFGAQDAVPFIPAPYGPAAASSLVKEIAEADAEIARVTQRQIAEDIANLMQGRFDLNLVLESILEGLYRALGMERVLFALLTPDRRMLREKSALGWPAIDTRDPIALPVATTPHNLFSYALERNETLWATTDTRSPLADFYTQTFKSRIGHHDCFIAPIGLNQKTIGLFYADRAHSHLPLTRELFESFRQLIQQANIALSLSQKAG